MGPLITDCWLKWEFTPSPERPLILETTPETVK
jgi:hypothetical protein